MKNIFNFLFSLLTLILVTTAQAQLTIVAVGQANVEQDKILIADPVVNGGDQKAAQTIVDVMRNDFGFYKKYFHVEKGRVGNSPNWSSLESNNISFAVQLVVEQSTLNLKAYKVSDKSVIVNSVVVSAGENLTPSRGGIFMTFEVSLN